MDKKIAEILAKVKSLGIENNTYILFTGDNGTSIDITSQFNGMAIQGGKGNTTEYGTHVPLFVFAPGLISNATSDALIDFTDFLPTLASIANIPQPKTYGVLDGISFYPALTGGITTRDWIFCHFDPHPGRGTIERFVQTSNYKYYEDNRFYDLINDILEENPIPDSLLTDDERTAEDKFKTVLSTMHK
jgi:arylsulfatase A